MDKSGLMCNTEHCPSIVAPQSINTLACIDRAYWIIINYINHNQTQSNSIRTSNSIYKADASRRKITSSLRFVCFCGFCGKGCAIFKCNHKREKNNVNNRYFLAVLSHTSTAIIYDDQIYEQTKMLHV